MSLKTRMLCVTALFAVLLALGAWVAVPTVPPFTMQTFVLYACVWLLGGKRAAAALTLYLLLGAVGIPVFAGFGGGVGVLFGPTGGYLLGFYLVCLCGAVVKKTTARRVAAMAVGTCGCYVLGTVWYAAVLTDLSAAGIGAALVTCVLPFVLPDAVKLALSVVVCNRLTPRLTFLER